MIDLDLLLLFRLLLVHNQVEVSHGYDLHMVVDFQLFSRVTIR